MKPEIMWQLAFDFYDCNNDDRISEFDLFKALQLFANDQLYSHCIH